jgi:hypothetical protein
MEHCCKEMELRTRTRGEWLAMLAEKGVSASVMGDPPEPLVKFERDSYYAIGHHMISYCPWCGTKLPSISIEDLKKRGRVIGITVDRDGKVTVEES